MILQLTSVVLPSKPTYWPPPRDDETLDPRKLFFPSQANRIALPVCLPIDCLSHRPYPLPLQALPRAWRKPAAPRLPAALLRLGSSIGICCLSSFLVRDLRSWFPRDCAQVRPVRVSGFRIRAQPTVELSQVPAEMKKKKIMGLVFISYCELDLISI